MVQAGFSLESVQTALQPEYLRALGLSVELALVSTVICLALAYPLCLILKERRQGKGVLIFLLFLLPLWMNSLLTTMAWQTYLERHGIINMLLQAMGLPALELINTPIAIVIGMVYNFLPYMVLPLYVAITRIDHSIVEAGLGSGGQSLADLSSCYAAIVTAGNRQWLYDGIHPALTTFVISALLGGNRVLLVGNIIEQEFTAAYDWQLGSALSMV
ncbi:MAG: ABC transporter permease [Selenomonas sp.]|jgi:spermidine/putrescine transport system permease protein|nr:ABC transporter permease [Selenomonas sp.]